MGIQDLSVRSQQDRRYKLMTNYSCSMQHAAGISMVITCYTQNTLNLTEMKQMMKPFTYLDLELLIPYLILHFPAKFTPAFWKLAKIIISVFGCCTCYQDICEILGFEKLIYILEFQDSNSFFSWMYWLAHFDEE